MSSGNEAPKLYTTKPKKSAAQLKKKQNKAKGGLSSQPPPVPAPPNPTNRVPPPPPPPPAPLKESFARRYKFLWPLLLTVNLAVGGYVFLRTTKKDKSVEDDDIATDAPSIPAAKTSAPALHRTIPSVTNPVSMHEPIPKDKQRELFQWMLEEKRKVVSKDPEEQNRIEEDKAILKEFILGNSIPSF